MPESSLFRPLVVNAHYAGHDRGLAADLFSVRGLGGRPLSVCTSLVVASHGQVTDVLDVPADTVDAQLQHVFEVTHPNSVKLGILGSTASVEVVFRRLERDGFTGPVLLDLTLSGPSGEDIASAATQDALVAHLGRPELVTIRRRDAELVAGMEIASLDDAQVAVQRLVRRGARRVFLRCGRLPARHFEVGSESDPAEEFVSDLFYDGESFALFEAPYLSRGALNGASSMLTQAYLHARVSGHEVEAALQEAKRHVTEAIRYNVRPEYGETPHYFWRLEAGVPMP